MTTPPTKLSQQFWSEVLADWGDSLLPPPQFDDLRAVLDYWLDCADQADIRRAARSAAARACDAAAHAAAAARAAAAAAAGTAASWAAYDLAYAAAYAAWREPPDAVSP